MPTFRYKAIAADGKAIDGELDAADERGAIAELRSLGYLPVSAIPASHRSDAAALLSRFRTWRARVRRADVTAVTRELATLLDAGIPLDESLRILERHAPAQGRLKTILQRVHGDVQSGKALSAALGAHEGAFDPLYVSLVRAGEASGSLAVVMARIASHREQADAFRATVVSALTYPIVLVCVAFVSLFVLLTFVIPRFIPLFEDAGETLPLLTEIVFGLATMLQTWWWVLVALALSAKAGLNRWFRVPGNRLRSDRWLLRAPVIGELVSFAETVRFARTLETLLRNGLPLLQSLRLVKDVQRNVVLANLVNNAIANVRGGGRLASALERERVLPDLAVEFVMIGEESGHLEDMLQKVAEMFEARAQQRLKRLLTLLEPALILGLGAAIAIVIVSILIAMLGLSELVA